MRGPRRPRQRPFLRAEKKARPARAPSLGRATAWPRGRMRSLRLEHLFKGLARVEHAVLAGVPLDGRVLVCRKAHRH